MWQADNCQIKKRNLPISNTKQYFYNINAHTKFGENSLIFTQDIFHKQKYRRITDTLGETMIPCHYPWWAIKKEVHMSANNADQDNLTIYNIF